MQKGQIGILIIVGILVVVAMAGGAYFLGRSSKSVPTTQPIPQTVNSQSTPTISESTSSAVYPAPSGAGDMANWKTYTNTKTGYQFKYPSNHTAYSEVDQKKPVLIPALSTSDIVNIASTEEMVFCCEPSTLSFSLEVSGKNPKQRAEEYLASVPEWETEKPEIKDTVFAGLPAVEAIGRGGYGPPYKLIVVSRMNFLLVIVQNANDPLLNQILST